MIEFPLYLKRACPAKTAGGDHRVVGDFILSWQDIMFLLYKQYLKTYAQSNRKIPTKAEWLVWNCILKGDKMWYRFLRQKPIAWYILDFYCAKLRLCIEVDGESHESRWEHDIERDTVLNSLWIQTKRYSDYDVEHNLEAVVRDIESLICERSSKLSKENPRS